MIVDARDPRARIPHDHDLSGTAGRFVGWAGLLYLLALLLEILRPVDQLPEDGPGSAVPPLALVRFAQIVPELVLATALMYAGLWIVRSDSLWLFRGLAGWVTALGAAAAFLVVRTLLDYPAVAESLDRLPRATFQAEVTGAVLHGAIYAAVLLPLGLLGFRTRRRFG